MRTMIEVYQNGYHIGEYPASSTTRVLGEIFSPFINQIKYMSVDALRKLVSGALEMLTEVHDTKRSRRMQHYGSKLATRGGVDDLLVYITNAYLSSEGVGLLAGFGMSERSTDGKVTNPDFFGNPERVSVTN